MLGCWGLTNILADTTERASYQEVNVSNGGVINGRIWFSGDYPKPQKMRVTKDPTVCGTSKFSEDFVVSPETKGLKNVVVSLLNVKSGKKRQIRVSDPQMNEPHLITPNEPIQLDQKSCSYVPHVQLAFAGGKLIVTNNDGILHNIHTYIDNTTFFNLAQPVFRKQINRDLPSRPGLITVKCDVHDWMNAYIIIVDHPYFAISDKDGKYTIAEVPPGRYKIQAWHEALGVMEKEVTVKSGETATVNYELLPEH